MGRARRWSPVRVGAASLAPVGVAAALVPLRAHVLNTNLALVLGIRASSDAKHAAVALADQLGMALLRYRRP